MSLLQASRVAFRHSSQPDALFSDLTCHVHPGDRVGLVGSNGSGMSTLALSPGTLLLVSYDRPSWRDNVLDLSPTSRGASGSA